jgi:hypothetical protein
MLDSDELTAMRVVANESLPDTCTIQTRTEVDDGAGGIVLSWANTYVEVPCRMAPAIGLSAANEDNIGARITGENVWTLTLQFDQGISQTDRVVFANRTFEVTYIGADRTWQILKRVNLVELA